MLRNSELETKIQIAHQVKSRSPSKSSSSSESVSHEFKIEKMNEIVISGISGKFPESESLQEFRENLFGGVDMVTDDERRWKSGIYGLPTRMGKLKQLDKFDADFFGVHAKQGNSMDPQLRILLELVYEAIVDAGVNPKTMRGSNTGVFIGCSGSESEKEWLQNSHKVQHGYTLTGCNRGMFSNRVSFTFDFHGPSFTVDTACSSSLVALSQAVAAIRLGHCDSAIVGGVHICLEPEMSLQFHRLNMLSQDGKCKAFDAKANGYVRSEAVVAIFLQKKKTACRIYATLVSARTSCDGFKDKGITFPSGERQMALLEDTYKEVGIDPAEVVYVEAHGTGTQAGDTEELSALASFFCRGRDKKKALLIGSVKSNMGHSEPSSGLCCIAKVLLAIERGAIPANLHFNTPNPNIPALTNRQLKVVDKNTPFQTKNSIIGVNSFGFGGANVHVILKSPSSSPEKLKPSEKLPYVIPYSSRTKEAVEFFLNQIKTTDSLDVKKMALLHEISLMDIPGFHYRGYAVMFHLDSRRKDNIVEIHKDPLLQESKTRQIWFIFNGMGSQWPTMGRDLLHFPVCANSLNKLANILAARNLDLLKILLNPKDQLNNVLHAFVAIASVQVALVDLLRSLGIEPDGIIGHSVGELACAYVDDCLTADQVILAAFYRGKAILESIKKGSAVEGAMAAVGLSWDEVKSKCPPGIYPACHNSKDSVTISGPLPDIKRFVTELQNQNIFAKEVNSSGHAFHSKYIEPARPKFKKYLGKIIPGGKLRSTRWISSSIPENQWSSNLCKYSSADYHVNNLISPVLFKEALEKIPEGSVVIEIGPHALLQAILKLSLPNCSNIGLLNKTQDNSLFLCQALGKMYNCGLNPAFGALYPKIEFPVFIEQPWPVPLVSWDHSSSWNVPKFTATRSDLKVDLVENSNPVKTIMEFSLEKDKFLVGHQIDGRVLFPGTGYIFMIWKAFSKLHNTCFTHFPVVIENFKISRATVLSKDKKDVQFSVSILPDSGHFEIQEKNALVASGNVRRSQDVDGAAVSLDNLKKIHGFQVLPTFEEREQEQKQEENGSYVKFSNCADKLPLSRETIYKELRLRGYEYSGEFRSISKSKINGGWSLLECFWDRRSTFSWISFLDAFVQIWIAGKQPRALYLPTFIDKIILEPQKLLESFDNQLNQDGKSCAKKLNIPVHFDKNSTCVTGAGVQLSRWKTAVAPRKIDCLVELSTNPHLQLEKYKFTPYDDEEIIQKNQNSLGVCIQIVLENILDNKLKVLEIIQKESSLSASLIAQVHSLILNQPTKFCQGKIFQLGNLQMEETLKNLLDRSGIEIKTWPDLESFTMTDKEMKSVNLLISSDVKTLDVCATLAQDGAFFLFRSDKGVSESVDLKELLGKSNVSLVARKNSHSDCFYLFKKTSMKIENGKTVEINLKSEDYDENENALSFNYNWVDVLKTSMTKAVQLENTNDGFRICIISWNFPNFPSGVLGLINCLRKEPGGDKIRCFFMQQNSQFQNIADIPVKILQQDLVMNVFESNVWGSYRFYPIKSAVDDEGRLKPVDHAFLNVLSRGNLSSLRWVESSLKYHQPKAEICAVYYAALNFRDVMISSGKLALDALPNNLGFSESSLGLEFSGMKDERSKGSRRIMGVVPVCGLSTSILPDPELLWAIPAGWTFKEGATIPVAYSTAYYALCVRGGLSSGESVLIHSGAGAVGIASISIALSMGCPVFTSVSSPEKKEFLQQRFPQLDDSCFCNSRDLGFLDHIMSQTKGRGVDLVLNSLAGDQLQASIKCLAFQGRFLEIGKVDLFNNSNVGLSVLLKNVSVHGILLDGLKQGDPDKLKIQELVQQGIDSAVVQPLPFTVFSKSILDVEKAFRFMASGKHRGKILLEIRNEEFESESYELANPKQKIVKAIPRCYFDPSKSYIIVGGLGGFGLELCGWLIRRGAKKLVLVSRSGIKNGYQDHILTDWRKMDQPAQVTCISTKEADVTTIDGALTLLRMSIEAFCGAPIGGIFNLAMVLADGLLENQTPENFDIVSKPKVNSSMALDQASRQLAPSLDHFVVFSSVVSGRGVPGLSNYAWANSAQERICENRRENGLPGLAIMWGAIGDVGVLQDEKGVGNEGVIGGTCPQRIQSCLQTLDILIHESETNPESCVLSSLVLPDKLQDGRTKSSTISSEKGPKLVESVCRILGLCPGEAKKTSPKKKLAEMGLDSLIGMEVKQLLENSLGGLIFTSSDVLGLTFEKIQQLEIEKMGVSNSNPAPSAGDCVLNIDEIEFCPKKQDQFSITATKSKTETTIEFPTDATAFYKAPKSNNNNCMKRFAHSIFASISYVTSVILLLFLGLLCVISLIIRQLIHVYLKLFQPSLKLMSGSFEQIFSHNPRPSNMTCVLRFAGTPDRLKVIKLLQERVFSLKVSQDGADYAPYDSLRWRISKGFFFNYWKKDDNFDLDDHVGLDICEPGMDLDTKAIKISEHYSNHNWDDSKPQWKFHVVTKESVPLTSGNLNQNVTAPEFLLIFSSNHAYGDAYSYDKMIRHCLLDGAQSNQSESKISPQVLFRSDANPESSGGSSRTRGLFSTVANAFSQFNLMIMEMTRIRAASKKDVFSFSKHPDAKKRCAISRLSLSQLKSVKFKDSGKPVGVTAVVLNCLSKAYARMDNEMTLTETESRRKPQKSLLLYIPNVISPQGRLNFTNNFSMSYTEAPIHFEDQIHTMTSEDSQYRLKMIQKNVTESTQLDALKASHFATQVFSLLTNQFKDLAYSILPTPSFLFTSVPFTIPRSSATAAPVTFLGGQQLKEFYGFSTLLPGNHGALGSLIDNSTDTLTLCLIIDDSVSAEFPQAFFRHFQEELTALT